MLAHRLRCWPKIVPTFGKCLVFAGRHWLQRSSSKHEKMTQSWFLAQHWTTTQQTQIFIFIQCRPNVFYVGPTLYKCLTNVLCLLGTGSMSLVCWGLHKYMYSLILHYQSININYSSFISFQNVVELVIQSFILVFVGISFHLLLLLLINNLLHITLKLLLL